jgi:hypothetical protein
MKDHFYLTKHGDAYSLSYGNGSPDPSCQIGIIQTQPQLGHKDMLSLRYISTVGGISRVIPIKNPVPKPQLKKFILTYMHKRADQIKQELGENIPLVDLT